MFKEIDSVPTLLQEKGTGPRNAPRKEREKKTGRKTPEGAKRQERTFARGKKSPGKRGGNPTAEGGNSGWGGPFFAGDRGGPAGEGEGGREGKERGRGRLPPGKKFLPCVDLGGRGLLARWCHAVWGQRTRAAEGFYATIAKKKIPTDQEKIHSGHTRESMAYYAKEVEWGGKRSNALF